MAYCGKHTIAEFYEDGHYCSPCIDAEIATLRAQIEEARAEVTRVTKERDEGGHAECPHKKARVAAESQRDRAVEVLGKLVPLYEEQLDSHSLCIDCDHWLPDHDDTCRAKIAMAEARALLAEVGPAQPSGTGQGKE